MPNGGARMTKEGRMTKPKEHVGWNSATMRDPYGYFRHWNFVILSSLVFRNSSLIQESIVNLGAHFCAPGVVQASINGSGKRQRLAVQTADACDAVRRARQDRFVGRETIIQAERLLAK